MKKKICIIGLGYIGLPTAAMFATHGHKIVGVDINKKVVDALNNGKITIYEPYLDIMVQAAVTSGNLTARTVPEEADAFIISVPTPITPEKTADMSFVKNAAESIVPFLREGNIVVLESTSPPGTVKNLLVPILERSGLKVGEDLLVAHCPERVLPGRILIELVENPRIIGGVNEKSAEAVKELYRTFVKGEIYLTDATTAEMCKLMENTFRDVNIALANELALLCEKLGINAWEVIKLSNKHPRVNIHQPGPGVGGHCIAVDPWFIVESNPDTAKIIKLGRQINDSMPFNVFKRATAILSGQANNGTNGIENSAICNLTTSGTKKIAILGITYKPNIDDTRESPIIELIKLFEKEGKYQVSVYDPHVPGYDHNGYKINMSEDAYSAAEDSDLLILAVNHDIFAKLDFEMLYKKMASPNILDTRNFWDRKALSKIGFNYYLLGDGSNLQHL